MATKSHNDSTAIETEAAPMGARTWHRRRASSFCASAWPRLPWLGLVLLLGLAGCSSPPAPPAPPAVTGSATYRERISLPPDAVLEVQLVDITEPGPGEKVLHNVTLSPITRVPVFFRIGYDPRRIDPERTYALKARILVAGKLRFLSTSGIRVLTNGYPRHRDLVLEMAREP